MQNVLEMGVKRWGLTDRQVSFITFVFQYAYVPLTFDLDPVSK